MSCLGGMDKSTYPQDMLQRCLGGAIVLHVMPRRDGQVHVSTRYVAALPRRRHCAPCHASAGWTSPRIHKICCSVASAAPLCSMSCLGGMDKSTYPQDMLQRCLGG